MLIDEWTWLTLDGEKHVLIKTLGRKFILVVYEVEMGLHIDKMLRSNAGHGGHITRNQLSQEHHNYAEITEEIKKRCM